MGHRQTPHRHLLISLRTRSRISQEVPCGRGVVAPVPDADPGSAAAPHCNSGPSHQTYAAAAAAAAIVAVIACEVTAEYLAAPAAAGAVAAAEQHALLGCLVATRLQHAAASESATAPPIYWRGTHMNMDKHVSCAAEQ